MCSSFQECGLLVNYDLSMATSPFLASKTQPLESLWADSLSLPTLNLLKFY